MENDLTNVDCRKSNFMKRIQFLPNKLRSELMKDYVIGHIAESVTKIGDGKFTVTYKGGSLKTFDNMDDDNSDEYEDYLDIFDFSPVRMPIQPC